MSDDWNSGVRQYSIGRCFVISLTDISFAYGEKGESSEEVPQTRQISDISLHVDKGEFVVLAGKSGCGKTTLTRIINGLCPQFYPGSLSGNYLLDGRDAQDISIDELGTIVGSVFQDPRSQFFASNTTDEMVLSMENHAYPRELMEERLSEVSSLVNAEKLLGRSIFPLSSGEKQRIAIGSVCALKPPVVVLDEPTSNLDGSVIGQLTELLAQLKEQGVTIVLSEHRLHYVRDIFDRMIVLDEGKITHNLTREEALSLSTEEMQNLGLRLFDEPTFTVKESTKYSSSDYLQCDEVSLTFPTGRVLVDVSLNSDTGHIMAIAGKNGAGKSTLCRVIAGLYKQSTGTVIFNQRSLKKKFRMKESFFVQQDTDYQLYAATVEEEFYIGGRRKKLNREQVKEYLDRVDLVEFIDRNPLSLSGGQKQRLLLALAASWNKKLLIFDEPTSGLDGANMRRTAELFKSLAKQGACILLITHDMELISQAADSLLYLEEGEVSYHRDL